MLTLILISLSTILVLNITRWNWIALFCSLTIATFLSINLMQNESITWNFISYNLGTDSLSTPLIILSCWLAPLCFLANNNIKSQNKNNQKNFLFLVSLITFFLILTFSSLNLLLFFICFETTLIPTLILIARWGANIERLQAGIYFLFYTLCGSLPLLISILLISNIENTLSFTSLSINNNNILSLFSINIWWLVTIIAFLIKMPIYGFHLWLPKAHVEAPISGSMILAAILLKLGGYGLIRFNNIFPNNLIISNIIIVICCWGTLAASIICLRQTDLKALIAYSSVGHMSLTAAGAILHSTWSLSGALMLMIAHGLISSALFALANIIYERTNTRNIFITRGFKTITSLLPLWWLIACICNLGIPPSPNLIGEILILTSIISWSIWLLPILGIATIFNTVYSLLIFLNTNTQNNIISFNTFSNINSREHIMILLHFFPLIFLLISPTSCIVN